MPVPSWSCDDGRHTLTFSVGSRLRPAEVADVDAIVGVLGPEERVHYGFTAMDDDLLRRFFEHCIHPARRDEEMLVMEGADGSFVYGGTLRTLAQPPNTVMLGGWHALGMPNRSTSDDWAMFAAFAHDHLGCDRALLLDYQGDGADKLGPARAAGYRDIEWPWPRTPLYDGRRVDVVAVEHRARAGRRACPRR